MDLNKSIAIPIQRNSPLIHGTPYRIYTDSYEGPLNGPAVDVITKLNNLLVWVGGEKLCHNWGTANARPKMATMGDRHTYLKSLHRPTHPTEAHELRYNERTACWALYLARAAQTLPPSILVSFRLLLG